MCPLIEKWQICCLLAKLGQVFFVYSIDFTTILRSSIILAKMSSILSELSPLLNKRQFFGFLAVNLVFFDQLMPVMAIVYCKRHSFQFNFNFQVGDICVLCKHSSFYLHVNCTSFKIENMMPLSWKILRWLLHCYTFIRSLYPRSPKGEGGILFYLCPSKIFFVAFFSATVDGRNLIFGHKRHIGIPYCG